MRRLRGKLTYANVIATLALFMAMSGGVVWAAHRIGANQLKSNSVGTAKLKKNAVTAKKIKKNAVTKEKIAEGAVTNSKIDEGAVDFTKIDKGTSVIASATGGPVAVNTDPSTPVAIPLTGTTSFTPEAGVVNLLNLEVRGIDLAHTSGTQCQVAVQTLVNGKLFSAGGYPFVTDDVAGGSTFTPVPVASTTGPIGLGQAGLLQQISLRVIGDTDCTATSRVQVSLAVTRLK